MEGRQTLAERIMVLQGLICTNCIHTGDEWLLCAFKFLARNGYKFRVTGAPPWSAEVEAAYQDLCQAHGHGVVESLECMAEDVIQPLADAIDVLRIHQYIEAATPKAPRAA